MPANPLDLVVTERLSVFRLNNNASDFSFRVQIDSTQFTRNEEDYIQACLNEPRVQTTFNAGTNHEYVNSCNVWQALVFSEDLNRGNIFFNVLRRFLDTLVNQEIYYVNSNSRLSPAWVKVDNDLNDSYFVVDGEEASHYPHYLWREDSIYGHVDNGMGFFINEDYVHCSSNDEYYVDSDVANNQDVYYNECCGNFIQSGDYCCSDNDDGDTESGEQFDNAYNGKYKEGDLSFVNLTETSGMDYTFGVELETCHSSDVPSIDLNVKAVYDGSTDGLEYVSGILQGNKGVEQVRELCTHLQESGALTDRKCGVHIHVGGANFNRRFSIMILKLCLAIEDDIYKTLPRSRADNSYCRFLPKNLVERMNFRNYKETLGTIICDQPIGREYNKKKGHPGGHYNSQRYYWANITNYSTSSGHNTVEFRPHGGTLEFSKVYNWMLICMAIVKFAENQQRRIWTSGMSKNPITLMEVLKYSLTDKLYKSVSEHCISRATKFGNVLS